MFLEEITDTIDRLRRLNGKIEAAWPHYHEWPDEAKDVGASIEMALVDLERCAKSEAKLLDALLEAESRNQSEMVSIFRR